jgi:UDP-N-acetylglucosamine:LPS N-acetylglucosamine transferase
VFEVGCPKLDPYVTRSPRPAGSPPVVVTSFHWDAKVCPETGSSFRFYSNAIAALARGARYRVMGHGHPLAMRELRRWYNRQRIPVIETFDEVLEVADVYITDGSSTLYEAAAAHIPVVVLNSPKYRRDVEHGIRFWEASTVGPNVNAPLDLAPAVRRALRLLPEDLAERERCLDIVYTHRDGTSAQRAADALRTLI